MLGDTLALPPGVRAPELRTEPPKRGGIVSGGGGRGSNGKHKQVDLVTAEDGTRTAVGGGAGVAAGARVRRGSMGLWDSVRGEFGAWGEEYALYSRARVYPQ
eukprot:COSAG01_NODE_2147_length_8301_cov_6.653621_3_plen_102_part_00